MEKTKFFKNKKIRILLIIETILLFIAVLGVAKGNRIEMVDEEMNLSLLSGEYIEDKGYVVDQTSDYAGTFLLSDYLKLTPGVYELVVHYNKTGEDIASAIILNEDTTFYGYRSSLTTLFLEEHVNRSQFYVLNTSDTFQVAVNFGGTDELTVSGIEIVHTNAGSRILVFILILTSLIIDGLLWIYLYLQENEVTLVRKVVWISIAVMTICASIPLLTDYTILGSETLFYLKRIEIIAQQISSGNWSARSVFLTIPALLRMLGFPMLFAYGMYIFLINLIASILAFLCFRKCFTNPYVAILGSAIYMLAPYRINLIYKVGDVGAFIELLLIPLLVCLFVEIFKKKNTKALLVLFSLTMVLLALYGVLHRSEGSILILIKNELSTLVQVGRMESWDSIQNIGISLFVGNLVFWVLCLKQKKETFVLKKEIYIAGAISLVMGMGSILLNLQFLALVSFIIPTLLATKLLVDVYDKNILNVYIILILTMLLLCALYQTNSILLTTDKLEFLRGYTLDTRGYKENIENWYTHACFLKGILTLCVFSFIGLGVSIIQAIKRVFMSLQNR